MKNEFLKYYLGEFYTDKVPKNIWNKCKEFSIKDNLIIPTSISEIKYVVSSLLYQCNDRLSWKSYNLNELLTLTFDNIKVNNSDFKLSYTDIYDPEILIMTEKGEPYHSYHKLLLQHILIERQIKKSLNMVIIFTTKNYNEYLEKETLKNFKILNYKSSNNMISENNIIIHEESEFKEKLSINNETQILLDKNNNTVIKTLY